MGPRGYPGPTGAPGPTGQAGPPGLGFFEAENKDSVILPAGCPVAVHPSGVGVVRAWAGVGSLPCVGLVRQLTAPTMSAQVQTAGELTLADWSLAAGGVSLVPLGRYFLSRGAYGTLTTAVNLVGPGILQQVGLAVGPDTMSIQLQEPYTL